MNILQVGTADGAGGAERVAWELFEAYRARGHRSRLVVGYNRTRDPDVASMGHEAASPVWSRGLWALDRVLQRHVGRVKGVGRINRWLRRLADPSNALDWWRGREAFGYPGTWHLLGREARPPDVLHLHNLHGDYFDLRALPFLGERVPVVLTLHDAWLLSGHCAYSFDCERWRTGCGACPDLTIPPAVRRDATAENWQRKRAIYEQSRLYVVTPCRWLMMRIEQSMLGPAVVRGRVIPNGLNLDVYRPGDQGGARAQLGLPPTAHVVAFTTSGIRRAAWKDYPTVRRATARLAEWSDRPVILLVVGDGGPVERLGRAEVRYVPFTPNAGMVARCYQAADLYLHAAHADTFPNVILEALACGVPVVATKVGGIPEQVDEGRTGFLVAGGDAEAMAARAAELLRDDTRRRAFGSRAAETARARFDLAREVDEYLRWYDEVRSDWNDWRRADRGSSAVGRAE